MKTLIGLLWCFVMALLLAVSLDGSREWRGKALTALLLLGLGTIVACGMKK